MNNSEEKVMWLSDDECDGAPTNTTAEPTFEGIVQERLSRRSLLRGAAASMPLLVAGGAASDAQAATADKNANANNLTFSAIALGNADYIHVASNYNASLPIAWGDPMVPGAPAFQIDNQTAQSQAGQFGYNCDFVGFFPLPDYNAVTGTRGVLVVNHEYTNEELMFTSYSAANPTQTQADVSIAAHGVSVVEIQRNGQEWAYVPTSSLNRRLTGETEMQITGPAAGHELMRTTADPTGTLVRGTLNNCAGGKTPWGTVLTAEENFHQYFGNTNGLPNGEIKTLHTRYGLPTGASERKWERFHDRFDVAKQPNESFRFGWVVEFDPYDPNSVPKKRTALGRFRHEAATTMLTPDGRVAFYSGDDQQFEYAYKFVTAGQYNPNDRMANMNLLDEGTLYVARFNANGSGEWLPLVFGNGPLTAANGFRSQADVLIKTRVAADLLGATKMDRPEDIEGSPVTGKVYIALTNNTRRTAAGTAATTATDTANPRPANRNGHIIELVETDNNHAALTFRWDIFMLCGNPATATDSPTFFAGFDPSRVSPISCPDNLAFDNRGNMWIATDGMPSTFRANDALYAVATEGLDRGYVKQFLSVPLGAEVCGPEFTPDNTTLFIAVQHPGEGGVIGGTTVSNWPHTHNFPRPGIVAVVKMQGRGSQLIGS